jgi:hypothetical protein
MKDSKAILALATFLGAMLITSWGGYRLVISPQVDATCSYHGKPYSQGATSRMDGRIVICAKGKWLTADVRYSRELAGERVRGETK